MFAIVIVYSRSHSPVPRAINKYRLNIHVPVSIADVLIPRPGDDDSARIALNVVLTIT